MQPLKTKEFLKCACLLALFILIVNLTIILLNVEDDRQRVAKALPELVASLRSDLGKQIDAKLDPLLAQYTATGKALAGTASQASGLLADVRREIPQAQKTATSEILQLNEKVDTLNTNLAKVTDLTATLKPTIDGLNLMFRRDAVPAQTLGLLGASKVAAGEVAQTMKTIRDTVKIEAAPTAEAVRKSAEGTARTTAATGALLNHVDDLLFGPKTFWQKFRGWLALFIGPGAVVARGAM